MTITKYVHSCLTVEAGGETLLFDPGAFSFKEGRVSPDHFASVDLVVLTHTHPDHVEPDALRRILSLSGARVVGSEATVAWLREHSIGADAFADGETTVGAFSLRTVVAPHEPIVGDAPPPNTAVLVNGRFLNPGDSFAASLDAFAGVEALAVPVLAPFLTEPDVVAFVERMRPAHVLPVHDGYAYPWFVAQRYDTFEPALTTDGRTFHRLTDPGDAVTI